MLFSFLPSILAMLLSASSAFGKPVVSNPCDTSLTYSMIDDGPVSVFNWTTYGVSEGELCCNLCYVSELNCVAAQWQAATEQCLLVTNLKDLHQDKTAECPLGQFIEGKVHQALVGWSGWIPGPCWIPGETSEVEVLGGGVAFDDNL